MILAQGESGGVPVWDGRDEWLESVRTAVDSPEGVALLRRVLSRSKLLAVAEYDAASATGTSGRDVATAHETVAKALGISSSSVQRARRILRALGLAVVVAEGRYLFTHERAAAGGQKRAASTRALTRPPTMPRPRRRPVDDLHRQVLRPRKSRVPNRSPRRAVDNFPRPIGLQRAAAEIHRRRPWLLGPTRHIGTLVDRLTRVGMPTDVTADEILTVVDDAGRLPSTPVRDPLAWFLHQVGTAALEVWENRARGAAPAPHRHDFRAMLRPGIRGCLTCPATTEVPT